MIVPRGLRSRLPLPPLQLPAPSRGRTLRPPGPRPCAHLHGTPWPGDAGAASPSTFGFATEIQLDFDAASCLAPRATTDGWSGQHRCCPEACSNIFAMVRGQRRSRGSAEHTAAARTNGGQLLSGRCAGCLYQGSRGHARASKSVRPLNSRSWRLQVTLRARGHAPRKPSSGMRQWTDFCFARIAKGSTRLCQLGWWTSSSLSPPCPGWGEVSAACGPPP